jgi:glycosyltransferase involved in cell wall biosynthesis
VKILHVISTGMLDAHFFRGLLQYGHAYDLTQDLWVLGDRGSLNAAFEEAGGRSANFLGSLAFAPLALRRFARLCPPDIVHAHLYRSSLAAAAVRAMQIRGPRLLVTRHHNDQHWLYGRHKHVVADAMVSRIADRVVAVSRQTAETIVRREHTPAKKVQVIEVGLDLSRFTPRTIVAPDPRSRPLLVAIGKPDMGKGFAVLLRAFREVRAAIPGATLRVVGPGKGFLTSEPGVELSGWLADVRPALWSADLFVHASFSEACCQALLEAVACGVRCVATRVGNAVDVVTPERGAIVAPRDSQALARAIIEQLGETPVIAPAGFAGGPFDNRVMVERYAGVYQAMVSGDAREDRSR